mgnify:CR=1 FL=1
MEYFPITGDRLEGMSERMAVVELDARPGALLFVLGVPLALWGLDASLRSPEAYAAFATTMSHPLAKLVALALLLSTLHHVLAGVRHLLLDVHVGVDLASARRSSALVLVLSLIATVAIAIRLW